LSDSDYQRTEGAQVALGAIFPQKISKQYIAILTFPETFKE